MTDIKKPTPEELEKTLKDHGAWARGDPTGIRADLRDANLGGANLSGAYLEGADLSGANLSRANLTGAYLTRATLSRANLTGAYLTRANLSGANLTRADLSRANLTGANLEGADLSGAYLEGANLSRANLTRANLTGANLGGANLTRANLTGANLGGANLSGAYLEGANLTGANLTGANLPTFSLVPEGPFFGWKKLKNGSVAKLLIPEDAARVSSLVGRKCRAAWVEVVAIYGPNGEELTEGVSGLHNAGHTAPYRVGQATKADSFDPDIRFECSQGIHFFITRKEAEDY